MPCRWRKTGRTWVGIAMLLWGAMSGAQAAATANQLTDHPSPYLAMHGSDPVAWRLWGPAVFEQARREGKLVYLSIGYFSCHWCHVMQRESYQDPAIAAYINRHFVPVKIDRELQPALDAKLIDFVERTRGYAGWPLNVFITPEGYPLFGLVYLPPEDFHQLLQQLQARWTAEGPHWQQTAKAAAEAMYPPLAPAAQNLPAGAGIKQRKGLWQEAQELADEVGGGFGEDKKFPMAPQLLVLLALQESEPDPKLGEFLQLTLDKMAQRGLRDQLRGGFFRYVVDPHWQIPHFEKMLYDNALLAEVYLRAARVFKSDGYRRVAHDTLDFMLRELAAPGGGFVTSLSAVDAQGREGGYYLWDDATLKKHLTPAEYQTVVHAWEMEHKPPLDDGHLPVAERSLAQTAAQVRRDKAAVAALLVSARAKLRALQARRSLPVDHKRLAAWNGLALHALALAAAEPGGAKYRPAAQAVRDYLLDTLWTGTELRRARSAQGDLGEASLEDYAYVALGLWTWSQLLAAEPAAAEIARLQALVQQAWRRFYSDQGWRLAETELVRFGGAEPALADGPMPSPSAVLLAVSLELAATRRDDALRARVGRALALAQAALQTSAVFWHASQAQVLVRYQAGDRSPE